MASRLYGAVLGTCALAVMVNAATFFLLGKTSPVSYQVMGHLKTVLVLGGGFLFFDTSANTVRRGRRERNGTVPGRLAFRLRDCVCFCLCVMFFLDTVQNLHGKRKSTEKYDDDVVGAKCDACRSVAWRIASYPEENMAGVSVAFMGCLLYAFLKDREMRRSLQQHPAQVGGDAK